MMTAHHRFQPVAPQHPSTLVILQAQRAVLRNGRDMMTSIIEYLDSQLADPTECGLRVSWTIERAHADGQRTAFQTALLDVNEHINAIVEGK
jgi:hypothetical protein